MLSFTIFNDIGSTRSSTLKTGDPGNAASLSSWYTVGVTNNTSLCLIRSVNLDFSRNMQYAISDLMHNSALSTSLKKIDSASRHTKPKRDCLSYFSSSRRVSGDMFVTTNSIRKG